MVTTTLTLSVVIIGILVSTAFFYVSMTLHSKQLGIGYWPLFGFAILFLTFGEFARNIIGNPTAFDFFFIIAMIMFGFAAIIKFWDIMRLIQ